MERKKGVNLLCLGVIFACGGAIAKVQVKDLEGKWCAAPNSVEELGAHSEKPNPTMLESMCIEFKLVRSNDEGGIGRYLISKKIRKGHEYPLDRHPLETYDSKNQRYEIDSPGLFTFYTTSQGEIILKDQSLSRSLVNASGRVDKDKKMKYLVTFKPRENQVDYASVSFVMLENKSSRLAGDFDTRWQSLRDDLDKVVTKSRRVEKS